MTKSVKKSQRSEPYSKPTISSNEQRSPPSSTLQTMLGSLSNSLGSSLVSIKQNSRPVYEWKNMWTMALGDNLRVSVDYSFVSGNSVDPSKCVLQIRNWYKNPKNQAELVASSYGVTLKSEEMAFLLDIFAKEFENGTEYQMEGFKVVPSVDNVYLKLSKKNVGVRVSYDFMEVILQILPGWMSIFNSIRDVNGKDIILKNIMVGALASELTKINGLREKLASFEANGNGQLSDFFITILKENGLFSEEKIKIYQEKMVKAGVILGLKGGTSISLETAFWEDQFIDVLHQFFIAPGVRTETDLNQNFAYLLIGQYML